MREAGYGEDRIARNLAECGVWRNVFVAQTDAEAERVGVPVFRAMVEAGRRCATLEVEDRK